MNGRFGASTFGHNSMNVTFKDLSPDALGGIRLWLEQNPPAIGISNILGYNDLTFTIRCAIVSAAGPYATASHIGLDGSCYAGAKSAEAEAEEFVDLVRRLLSES